MCRTKKAVCCRLGAGSLAGRTRNFCLPSAQWALLRGARDFGLLRPSHVRSRSAGFLRPSMAGKLNCRCNRHSPCHTRWCFDSDFRHVQTHGTAGKLHPGEILPPAVSRRPTVSLDVRPDRAARACEWRPHGRNGAKRSGGINPDWGLYRGASKIHLDKKSMPFR